MAAVLRLKRKACDEPAEGLLIALKKPKCSVTENVNEVLFKFAATLNSEKESVKDHIQAALSRERAKNFKWREPKNTAIEQSSVKLISEKLKAEHKVANEKKRLDLLNNRRLILAETLPVEETTDFKDTEVRNLFHLYDITEENEEVKKQADDTENVITCNGEPLIKEKAGDYVFDVYIADGHIDDTFVESTVSVRPCTLTMEDIYSGDSEDSEECYEDDDDSNDENNWRNDYPDEEYDFRQGYSYDSDEYDAAAYSEDLPHSFHNNDLDESNGLFICDEDFASEIMQELTIECEDA